MNWIFFGGLLIGLEKDVWLVGVTSGQGCPLPVEGCFWIYGRNWV